jgi:hypothetical protein
MQPSDCNQGDATNWKQQVNATSEFKQGNATNILTHLLHSFGSIQLIAFT